MSAWVAIVLCLMVIPMEAEEFHKGMVVECINPGIFVYKEPSAAKPIIIATNHQGARGTITKEPQIASNGTWVYIEWSNKCLPGYSIPTDHGKPLLKPLSTTLTPPPTNLSFRLVEIIFVALVILSVPMAIYNYFAHKEDTKHRIPKFAAAPTERARILEEQQAARSKAAEEERVREETEARRLREERTKAEAQAQLMQAALAKAQEEDKAKRLAVKKPIADAKSNPTSQAAPPPPRQLIGQSFQEFCNEGKAFLPSDFQARLRTELPGVEVVSVFRLTWARELYYADAREGSAQCYWCVSSGQKSYLVPCPAGPGRFEGLEGFLTPANGPCAPETLTHCEPALLLRNDLRWEIHEAGRLT